MKLWLTLLITLTSQFSWAGVEPLIVGHFSLLPKGEGKWPRLTGTPLSFAGIDQPSTYSHIIEDGHGAIKAQSTAGASGLMRKITINPQELPILTWHWKIAQVVPQGDVTSKAGDDYAARIYITFAYDPNKVSFWERVKFNTLKLFYGDYPPIAAINYVWASKATPGLITPNPFTNRVQMIIVESGNSKAGSWQVEHRNIAEDYQQAFGESAPRISGVAIMTDTDNTLSTATAWYGDIIFTPQDSSVKE